METDNTNNIDKTGVAVLNFTVNGQKIYFDEKNKTVADSRQYLYAAFEFSGEWQNPKIALFSAIKPDRTGKTGRKSKSIKPTAVELDENDGCYVPSNVIKSPGFYVSAYCADGEKFITADKRKVNVSPSGYSEKSSPPDLPDPLNPPDSQDESPGCEPLIITEAIVAMPTSQWLAPVRSVVTKDSDGWVDVDFYGQLAVGASIPSNYPILQFPAGFMTEAITAFDLLVAYSTSVYTSTQLRAYGGVSGLLTNNTGGAITGSTVPLDVLIRGKYKIN